jgi:hypothetical protein
MGVRLCGVTPADREKGIETQKGRPVKLPPFRACSCSFAWKVFLLVFFLGVAL